MRKHAISAFLGLLMGAALCSAQIAPQPVAAYEYAAGAWSPLLSSASGQGLPFAPPAVAVYCYNSSTQLWVPGDSSCFGGTLTLTTVGSSGPATYSPTTHTLNVPQYAAGAGNPVTYSCVNSSADEPAIQALLTSGGYVVVAGTCGTFTSQLTIPSNTTLNFQTATITCNVTVATTDLRGCFTNAGAVTPVENTISCTLTAGSNTATACTGVSFVNTVDVDQTVVFPNAMGNSVTMGSTIATVSSTSAFTMTEAVPSFVTTGTFAGDEIIRDHDITIYAGTVKNIGNGSTGAMSLVFANCNRCKVYGGNWSNPNTQGHWQMAMFGVEQSGVDGSKFHSYGGSGQDGLDFEGNWHNVYANNVTCNTSDDCITFKDGGDGFSNQYPIGMNGGGFGGYVSNLQGTGQSGGVHVYASCANSSGTNCSALPVSDIRINGISCSSITTSGPYPCFKVALAVQEVDTPGSTIPTGPPYLINNIVLDGLTSYPYQIGVSSPVQLGTTQNFTQYYGSFTLRDIANFPGSVYSVNSVVTVDVPANGTNTTNIQSISIDAPNYNHTQSPNTNLFSVNGGATNATIG